MAKKQDTPGGQAAAWEVDVPVTTVSTETTTPEVRTLTMEMTDEGVSQIVTLRMGLTDAAGSWRPGVMVPVLRLLDDPAHLDPVLRQAATHMADLILFARVDGANPLAAKYGIANNTPLGEAAAQIGWAILNPPAPAEAQATPETPDTPDTPETLE